jgi:hypothetical protein
MEAAPTATPPQQLFRELLDLGNLIFSMSATTGCGQAL